MEYTNFTLPRNEMIREECAWSIVSGDTSEAQGCNCSDQHPPGDQYSYNKNKDLESLNRYTCEFPTIIAKQFSRFFSLQLSCFQLLSWY